MNRREFLAGVGSAGTLAGIGSLGLVLPITESHAADDYFWNLPRVIKLKRAITGEVVEASYFDNGQLNIDGYIKICRLLRDPKANAVVQMDLRLLDLIRAVQYFMHYHKYTSPFVITSAYRTLKTNSNIEGAAKNSMHMQGKAIDFVLPGVPATYMSQLASYYRAGGVGFYPVSGFTHMDTGNVRYWTEALNVKKMTKK